MTVRVKPRWQQSATTNQYFSMAALLLLGFGLRVFRLQRHNLWGDEAFSLAFSKQPLQLVLAAGAETHPPLYHALLHFWIPLAGQSLFTLRFLSVLPGVLLLALLFVLGRRILGAPVGLLASGLCTISSFAVYYSQETRMYAWVACFCALALYADARWQHTAARRWEVLFMGATLAAIFTHYYAFFVLLGQNIYRFLRRREDPHIWPVWLRGQFLIALAYLPWVLAQSEFISAKASARWDVLGKGGLDAVWAGTLTAFGVGQTVSSIGSWMGIALLVPLAIGLRSTLKVSLRARMLMYGLFVPLVGAWLIGPLMPFYFPRYLIVALPAYLLLVAGGLCAIARPSALLWVLLALIANGWSLHNYFSNPVYAKGGYGDLMAYVDAHREPGDGLLLQNGAQASLYDYYGSPMPRAYNVPPLDDAQTEPLLQLVSSRHDRIWLVMYGDPAGYDPQHELEYWLHLNAFRTYHGDYGDGSLDLFVSGDITLISVPEVSFGDRIALVGFGIFDGEHSPGGTMPLALAWRALSAIERDYTTFVHMVDGDGLLLAQIDSQPLGATRPTSRWQLGETVIDRVALPLADDMPSGEYRLQVGWYDLESMQRLPAVGARSLEDRVQLGMAKITSP